MQNRPVFENFSEFVNFLVGNQIESSYTSEDSILESIKDDLEKLVKSIRESEDKSVKSQTVYEPTMDWFQYLGNPPDRSKDAENIISTEEDMYQSMMYWQGDLTKKLESSSNLDELIKELEPWTKSEKVKDNLEWVYKRVGSRNSKMGQKLNCPEYYDPKNNIKFNRPWIVDKGDANLIHQSAAGLISKRVTELKQILADMLKSGKTPGAPVDPSDKESKKYAINLVDWGENPNGLLFGERSIGAVPFSVPLKGKKNPWEFRRMNTKSEIDPIRRKWGYWLGTICTDQAFEELKNKLSSPKYIVAKSVPITDSDRIKILNTIKEKSEKYDKKVEDATYIKIKPAKAIESRSKTTKPGEDKVTTRVEELNYAFPFSKAKSDDPAEKASAEEMAITMFDNDSAIIKDNIKSQLSLGIDDMISEIKKLGELVSLEYKTIASTSDEPSAYIRPNKKGTTISPEANIPLAEDRAAAIETAFLALAKEKGINPTKIEKGTAVLYPNNTLRGSVVYSEKKNMRANFGGTSAQDAEYKKLFAQPKFSGIAFEAKINVVEEDIEPTEETVEDYDVKGEWRVSIGWKKKSKNKRSSSSYKYRRKIDWNRIFPDMGSGGGGSSVKDLCAAYGGK